VTSLEYAKAVASLGDTEVPQNSSSIGKEIPSLVEADLDWSSLGEGLDSFGGGGGRSLGGAAEWEILDSDRTTNGAEGSLVGVD
jgi:hypothetical protein